MGDGRKRLRAFTFLELLMAMAIMVAVAGSLYATLYTAFKARRSAMAAVEPTRKVEMALECIQCDLSAAVIPNGILAGLFLGTPEVNDAGQAADVLLLHSTTIAAKPDAGQSDVQQVEFLCEPDEDGTGLMLVRRVTRTLLATTVQEAEEEVLCRGVHAFALQYYDGLDWVDAWDSSTQNNTLPVAVKVTLQLCEEQPSSEDGDYSVSRMFLIPCGTGSPSLGEGRGSL